MKFLRKAGLILLPISLWLFATACGDTYRPVANPLVGPGGQPQTAYNAYLLSSNPNGFGSTDQINVSGDTSMQVLSQGRGSHYEAFMPGVSTLLIANSEDDSVSAFTPSTSASISTINLLPGSHPVFLGSSQISVMYTVNSGPNSECPTSGSISSISSSYVLTGTVCVGQNPTVLAQAPNGGNVFVINSGNGSVLTYNPSSGQTRTLTSADGLAANPVYVVAGASANYGFVLAQGDGTGPGTLDIVSGVDGSLAGSQPLGVRPTFGYIDSNLSRLYIVNNGSNTVTVLDISNLNFSSSTPAPVLATVDLGATGGTGPVAVTTLPDKSRFYVANAGSNNVSVVSQTSFQVLKTVAVQSNPVWIAADPGSTKVYVVNQGSNTVSVIRTSDNTITVNLPAPQQDFNCQNSSTSACPLQTPMMVLTQ